MDAFLLAAGEIFTFELMFLLFCGVFVGIIVGAIPGLTPTMAIAIMTSFTFHMQPVAAVMTLLGVYFGGIYGGSVSAILLNIPGTPSAVMTAADGYAMARKGKSAEALGIATWSSFLGGTLGMIVLIICAPVLTSVAIRFSAPEMFALAVFGLSLVTGLSGKSLFKGFLSAILGIIICMIGRDPVTGVLRFSLGLNDLTSGFSFVPLLIGLFGFAEVFNQVSQKKTIFISQTLTNVAIRLPMIKRLFPTILRSSAIGVFIGILPGAGSTIASFIAYDQERKRSPNPEEFGTGKPEGIAAPEAANNASCGGALMPMLTLGIPGDAITAILIGALALHNIQPGPLLFIEHPEIVYSFYIGGIVANFFMIIIGFVAAVFFARIINFPQYVLFPIIMLLCVVGAYSVNNSAFDVYTAIGFGVFAYTLTKFDVPLMPMVLGIVLGPILEENLRTMILMSLGDFSYYLNRPIALFIFLLTIISIIAPIIKGRLKKNKNNN